MAARTLIAAAVVAWAGSARAAEPLPVLDPSPSLRIVLMRHGVRSPTKAPEALAPYADKPWAAWPVAPGQLTPHGAAAMRALGGWWRHALGLERPEAHCTATAPVLVISDSTPRNHASASALVAGLLPGCAAAGHFGLPPGEHDPLFQGRSAADEEEANAAQAGAVPQARLAELQAALIGGDDEAHRQAARAAGRRLLIDLPDPRKAMGTLAENLMLEYAEGLPMPAWGRLDEAGIGRIVELHNAAFEHEWKADRAASRRRASDLLARIAEALRAGDARPFAADAKGPVGAAVFLIGHDTNLAAVAGLLGLDWHDPARPDDYPPGGALVFDLVAGAAGPAVRLSVAMPTLSALRRGGFDGAGDMVVKTVAIPLCDAGPCTPSRFAELARRAIDLKAVVASEPARPFTP